MPEPFLIEDGIRETLLTLPAVTALVGQRIRPGVLDEGDDLPGIVISILDEEHQNDLSQRGGLVKADVLIVCIAKTHREARLLSKAVSGNNTDPATGFNGFEGAAGDGSIDSCELINESYFPVAENDDGDGWRHIVSANYEIWYTEPTR